MTLNYERLGRNPAIPTEYKTGVGLMNKFAKSLEEAGLLPRQFPKDPRLEKPQGPRGDIDRLLEETDLKEINTLESHINSIKQAVLKNDERTLSGFSNLRQALYERYTSISGFKIETILKLFNRSMEQYKGISSNLYTRVGKTHRKVYFNKRDTLDPRQMRVIIFSYNLLPDNVKTPKTLAQEEEIKNLKEFRGNVERRIAFNL